MSTGDFFSLLGDWLLDEPVHHSMMLTLAFLTLFLWVYMLVAYHFLHGRLLSIELRHQGLVERTTTQNSDMTVLRRDTLNKIGEVMTRVTSSEFEALSDGDSNPKDDEDPLSDLDKQLDTNRRERLDAKKKERQKKN